MSENLLAGRYELSDPLGVGGMAEVHRAWDTVLCRDVAIKLFPPSADAEAGRRFDNEVRTLARLSHHGLVSVYDAGTSGRTPFVVLQLVDGCTLRDRITEGALPVAEVRRLGARLADALTYVHAQGVVHRDVKPSNILLDHANTPYLADFGLAHLAGSTRLTRTDQMVGTAAYLAPEQVRGAEIGHAADIYAFGLVLLECLTGRREYGGGEIEAAVARLHRQPVIPDDLPSDLARLLTLMTSQSANRRPTAADCARALRGDGLPVGLTGAVPAGSASAGAVATDAVLPGGVPTGAGVTGSTSTGAVPTGAVPTGPVPTGGVPTGGVPTGAIPTGHGDGEDTFTSVLAAPRARPRTVPKKAILASAAGLLGAIGIAWAVVPGPTTPVTSPASSADQTTTQSTTPSPNAASPNVADQPVTSADTGTATEPVIAPPVAEPPPAATVAEPAPVQNKVDNSGKGNGNGKAKKDKP